MPLVKLTISEEPFDVGEDEVDTLRAQGLLEEIHDEPAPPPTRTAPAADSTEE